MRGGRQVRKRWLAFVLVSVWAASSGGIARGASLGLATGTPTVGIGETVFVDIVLTGLAGAAVGAYDLDLIYPDALLSFVGVDFQGLLGSPPTEVFQDASGGAGLVDFAELSLLTPQQLDALQGDALLLASIEFTAAGVGSAVLPVADDGDLVLSDAFAAPIPLDRPFGSVTITIVPEPASGLLVAAGLVALCRRRPARA